MSDSEAGWCRTAPPDRTPGEARRAEGRRRARYDLPSSPTACCRQVRAASHLRPDLVAYRGWLHPTWAAESAVDASRRGARPPEEPDALADALGMVIDDSLVDRIAHSGARINRDLVDTEHAAFGNLIEGDSRNRQRHVHRTTRRRAVRRHVQQKQRRRPSTARNLPKPERARLTVTTPRANAPRR